MKKLLLILTLIVSTFIANAQTEQQTLEWLNVKKSSFAHYGHTEISYYTFSNLNEVKVSTYGIKSEYISINWSEIKEIKKRVDGDDIKVIVKSTNDIISLWTKDNAFAENYIKALKHMADLKGAKLVDDNLFGN